MLTGLCGVMCCATAGGVLEVNAGNDPELFSMAKVGLGCLGVVTELTLKVRQALMQHMWGAGVGIDGPTWVMATSGCRTHPLHTTCVLPKEGRTKRC